jgi:F0F1-type ATP synthase gamma subunit
MPITERAIDNYMDRDPIFAQAAMIASKIVAVPYDVLTLYYNHYESQVKFKTVAKRIPQFAGMAVGVMPGPLKGYAVEPENNEEALVNMQEYAIASALYFAFLETAACETSQ